MSTVSVVADEDWECENCTYINTSADLTCVMCYKVRVCVKDLSVTWQWQAADQWIPYDLPTTLQLEQAFQAGESKVALTVGWFAENDGYIVTFRRPTASHRSPAHYQTNSYTRNHRKIRRIAEDEIDLFHPVNCRADLQRGERCAICQLEFDEQVNNSESSSSSTPSSHSVSAVSSSSSPSSLPHSVVRLRHCAPGHAFHHSCISSWIKLNDKCPYCSVRL